MTGPGRVLVYRHTPTALDALLYNFEVGSSVLKAEHVNWIMTQLTPYVRNRQFALTAVGLASRTGNDASNMVLSKNRALTTLRQINFFNPGRMSDVTDVYVGERAAALLGFQDRAEDERFRGVYVIAQLDPVRAPHVRPPRKFIARRTSALVLVKEAMRTDEGFQDGSTGYRAGKLLAKTLLPDTFNGILKEEKQDVDENFAVLRITVDAKEDSYGISGATLDMKTFTVTYEWGPWVRGLPGSPYAKLLFKASDYALAHGSHDEIVDIDALTAIGWERNPLRMYEKKYGISF
jgi:hypothetical protein